MIALLIACAPEQLTAGVAPKGEVNLDFCNGVDDDQDDRVDEDAIVYDPHDHQGADDDPLGSGVSQYRDDQEINRIGYVFPEGDVDHLGFFINDGWNPAALCIGGTLKGLVGTRVDVLRVEVIEGETELVPMGAAGINYDGENRGLVEETAFAISVDEIFEEDSGDYVVRIASDSPSCEEPYTLNVSVMSGLDC